MQNNKKIAGGFLWSFAEQFGSQAASLIVSIVLARLVDPSDYGLIAAAHIFTSVANIFITGGFGSSIIQKKDADEVDYSSMFYFNVFFSIVVYVILFFISPVLVRVFNSTYDYESLTKVIRWMGIGLVFASFNSFYRSLLSKRLLFKKIFFVTISSTIISAILGVTLAYKGAGVWALVSQSVSLYVLNSIFFIFTSKWVPKLIFSWQRLKGMLSYGFKLMASSLFTKIYQESNNLVVGNRYSADMLAYYNKGLSFPKMIVQNMMSAINVVLFPAMALMDSKEELRLCVKKFSRTSTFVIAPMMFGMAAVSNTFIPLLLTEKWSPCIIYLQIACFDYALQPMGLANLQMWKATGRATRYLVADIIKKIIGFSLLFVAVILNRGVLAISIATLISTIIGVIINILPGKKLIDYSIFQQVKDVVPFYLLSSVMYVSVFLLGKLYVIPSVILLAIQIIAGIIIYFGLSKLFKFEEIEEVKVIIKSKVGKK